MPQKDRAKDVEQANKFGGTIFCVSRKKIVKHLFQLTIFADQLCVEDGHCCTVQMFRGVKSEAKVVVLVSRFTFEDQTSVRASYNWDQIPSVSGSGRGSSFDWSCGCTCGCRCGWR